MTSPNPTQDSTAVLTYPLGEHFASITMGRDSWDSEHHDASQYLDARIRERVKTSSSTTPCDAWYSTMYFLFEESFNSTVAQIPLVQEHERLAFTIENLVRKNDPSENLFKLRRLTGYSAERLASLLEVGRETIESWLRGEEISKDCDVNHINKALSVIQFSDRGTADENARALEDFSLGEVTPFEAIKSHRYSEAMRWLSFSPARHKMEREKSVWENAIGEFQPILLHDEADGTETTER